MPHSSEIFRVCRYILVSINDTEACHFFLLNGKLQGLLQRKTYLSRGRIKEQRKGRCNLDKLCNVYNLERNSVKFCNCRLGSDVLIQLMILSCFCNKCNQKYYRILHLSIYNLLTVCCKAFSSSVLEAFCGTPFVHQLCNPIYRL